MVKFISKRLVQMFLLFVIFLTILFFLLEAQPGDLSQQLIGNPDIPPEAKAQLAARLGLDQPLWGRYWSYITNFFTGDMGVALSQYPTSVSSLIIAALPRTLVLFLSATLLAYYVGFVTGKVLAWRRGKATEYLLTLGGVGLYTVFYPWFALLMIWALGFTLSDWLGFRFFPIGRFIDTNEWAGGPFTTNQVFSRMIWVAGLSMITAAVITFVARRRLEYPAAIRVRNYAFLAGVIFPFAYFNFFSPMRPYAWDILTHTALPVITLTLVAFAGIMLLTRSSMLETLREDYILTARAKGLSEKVIRDKHAARNALLPVVTSLVLALAFVISGGIITETVFSWPGIGRMLFDAVVLEDIPLAMGALSIIAVLALIGHLIADILYMYLDPRIRYQ
ncbi:MAG: ABC transporter permease [Actinomycetota bacterium]|jgi:peptide/nickel transport system permease protein|nr:ABC transporter permease [Actinomycetota bacterium]